MNGNGESDRALRALLVLMLAGTIVGGAVDLYLDAPDTWRSPHRIWALSPAEPDAALRLLKGQQPQTDRVRDIPQRAYCTVARRIGLSEVGLAGRAELAAFFLEDLLLPQTHVANE